MRILVIAIAVAIAVPVSTLKLQTITQSCCCPDPSKCKCPDHKGCDGKTPTIRACHKTTTEWVTPELPSFEPSDIALAEPVRVPVTTLFVAAIPHDPPPPARPDAPS